MRSDDTAMSYFRVLGLAAAMAATTVPALAQNAPPTPNPAMRQQFQQMRSQMREIRSAERAQILGALTSAHKTLLANVVGRLATSANPDFEGAARQLDSALSANEKQTIVNAAQNARAKQRSLMQSMREQSGMGPGPWRHGPESGAQRPKRAPDAGRILLGLAIPGPGMMGPRMHP
jgi:hypothetical protein